MAEDCEGVRGANEAPVGRLRANRRQMLLGASFGALFAGLCVTAPAPARMLPSRGGSVLSFHRDEPWVDPAGVASPYHPPHGARGGAALAGLSDEALRRLDCYL
ncbi:MAG: hypothetical protein J0I80_11650 [Sphingomonas sp.]|nr:hypothetical protein [Sphingomonas sp.]